MMVIEKHEHVYLYSDWSEVIYDLIFKYHLMASIYNTELKETSKKFLHSGSLVPNTSPSSYLT